VSPGPGEGLGEALTLDAVEKRHILARPVVDWSADLERCLASAQMQQLIWKAIELLQPLDKAVLVLSDCEDLPNREIGEALGLTVLAVKARLHRARLFLRGQLAVALGRSPASRQEARRMAESAGATVTCAQVTALLIDYVAGDLDPATTLVLEQHVQNCPDCLAFLRTYRESIRLTRTLRYEDIPGEIQNRVHAFLCQKMTGESR
jgi:RNA polymerase sigma-70 factor (ECF subfamily)